MRLMTTSDPAPDGDNGRAAVVDPGSDAQASATDKPVAPSIRRYVAIIAAGLVVAAAALTTGFVLLVRSPAPDTGAVVGSGAQPAPQPTITAAPLASLTPDSPPAVLGDHLAGDAGAAFYLRAADQQGDGRLVVVEDVTFLQGNGWVVVHSDVGDAPGPILGVSSEQTAGHHVDVVVTLKAPVTSSSNVFVMLHTEDNGDATFDYPQSDQPAQLGGQIVMVPVYLKVQ